LQLVIYCFPSVIFITVKGRGAEKKGVFQEGGMRNRIKKIFFLCWIVSFFFVDYLVMGGVSRGSMSPKKVRAKPYVTCHFFQGQLGNQLHRIATTLAYAWDHNMIPIFPELKRTDLNIPINRQRVFFRLDDSPLPRPVKCVFRHRIHFEKKDIPIKPDLELFGYFQTWKYFDHHREKIMDIFSLRPNERAQIQLKYAELLNHPCTVGVHVRTFNKEWSKCTPFVGLAYYEKALKNFPQEALFIVFSDRINWCKHHFEKFNRPILFIDGNDYIEDFFLMSMFKHNIIGNSSFSWWAAYLNKNPNKIVVAPSHFISQSPECSWKPTNANLPDWITIKSNPDHSVDPYPEDVYDYDAISQSINTQKEIGMPQKS